MPDKYRGGCSQPTIQMSTGCPVEERKGPWTCEGSVPHGREMPHQGSRIGSRWVREQGEKEWDRRFSEGKPGKGIAFEM